MPSNTNLFTLLFTLGTLAGSLSYAQSTAEKGFPLITNHSFRDYGGAGQNWALLQGDRGKTFAGNNQGLLE